MGQPLVILGTHWLAEEMFDLISDIPGYEVTAFIENLDPARCRLTIEDRPVRWVEELPAFASTHQAICALGTTHRWRFIEQAAGHGMRFATLIHPTARVSSRAELSEGCFLSAHTVVSTRTRLEPHVFVNRGTLLGHHVHLGACVSLQCGVNLAGNVTVGARTYVGLGAMVLEQLRIGSQCVIAAGSLVTRDVPDRVQVMGQPARIVKSEIEGK